MRFGRTILVAFGLFCTLNAADVLTPPETHEVIGQAGNQVSPDHLAEIAQFEGLDHHNGTIVVNGTYTNMTLHDHINESLGDDEERVLAGGEVKIRKKRTFCRRCYPSRSYGYGGGGGCCAQCGQCGGGRSYYRPTIAVVRIPYFGGGGGGCCRQNYNPCNVCGR